MFKCDYEKISGRHSGEWMNRLTSDTVVVAEGMTQMTPGITGMLIRLLGALILLIMMYPMFGYLILPVGLLLLGVNAVFRKILKKLHKQVQEADGNLRIFLQESLAGMLVIRVFGKEKQIVENANEKMAGHKKARMRRNHISNLCNSGFNGAMNVAYVVGTAVGGYGILTGTITYYPYFDEVNKYCNAKWSIGYHSYEDMKRLVELVKRLKLKDVTVFRT